jgi:ABC-type nickel/cobalt efflux system permease component RcnA
VFGLDDSIASLSDGTSLLLVVGIAVLLGLRHATDPDHLAAVTTLVASKREGAARRAAGLGVFWGLGHGLTLFVFGVPIVLFQAYLPERVQQAAEASVGVLIVALAVWLLIRWRRGRFHVHEHDHEGDAHVHLHRHAGSAAHGHEHRRRTRSPLQAFAIGLLHGMGGSAGVGVLIVATIESSAYALVALGVLGLFTAVSMTVVTTGFGLTLTSAPFSRSFHRVAPVLGVASLAFGAWYALAAFSLAPYSF